MISKPLLAEALKTESDWEAVRWPLLCSRKLDGIRALKIDGKVVSRNFKPIPNKFIQKELSNIIPNGFDGEIMLRDPKATFQDITSAVMSHEGEPDYVYWAFDYVKVSLETPYKKRVVDLIESGVAGERVQFLKPVIIRSKEELDNYELKCLERGFEGVMIRDPFGKYKCGRSTLKEGILLKVKRWNDSEAEIIGMYEKLKNDNVQEKNELGYAKRSKKKEGMVGAGTLGGFDLKDIHTGVEFSIGSGFDDAFREKIWKNQKKYMGRLVKYKFQPVGVKESTGVPRFPIFCGFRSRNDMSE